MWRNPLTKQARVLPSFCETSRLGEHHKPNASLLETIPFQSSSAIAGQLPGFVKMLHACRSGKLTRDSRAAHVAPTQCLAEPLKPPSAPEVIYGSKHSLC